MTLANILNHSHLLFWESKEANAEFENDTTEQGRDQGADVEVVEERKHLEPDPRPDQEDGQRRDDPDVAFPEPI